MTSYANARAHGWIIRLLTVMAMVVSLVPTLLMAAPAAAASVPSVLVITDGGSGNPFGAYLKEMLSTEGVRDVEVQPISNLNSALLTGRRAVILGESNPNASQVSALDSFVTAGGGLVAMKPTSALNAILGISLQSGTTSEGYMQITDASTGAGLYTGTMQYHGVANHYNLAGATQIAKLYTDRSSPTSFPAVTIASRGSGKAAMFAYDLARSVVYTRQGNPASANVDVDHDGIYRVVDLITNYVDLQRTSVPQADIQQRLLVRLLNQVDAQPVPLLWYFPNAAPTVLVVTADSHANPISYYQTEIDTLKQHGVKLTIYLSPTAPDKSTIDAWKSQGVDIGPHPYVDCGYNCGYSDEMSSFESTYGFNPKTTRTHQVRWQGWTDSASIEASFGLQMDFTSGYQWGPYLSPSGVPVIGYATGSGLPMHFIDSSGNIIQLYQQNTVLVDEEIAPNIDDGGGDIDLATALADSRQVIDDSVSKYHTPITMQAHVDYFGFGGVNEWDLGTVDYAIQKGAASLTAQGWLDFVNQRAATTMSNTSWQNNTLTFTVSAGGSNQSMMLPLRFRGASITSVKLGGTTQTYATQTIDGTTYAVVTAKSGTYTVAYAADTTPPSIQSMTPANSATNVPTTSPITVQFSEVMDRSSSQASLSVNPSVAGTFSWDASGTTMSFNPTNGLGSQTNYTATVSTGATDLAGNHLTQGASTSFTTARITPPPTITSVSPATGFTGGGTTVTITGTDFTGASAVNFDTTAASFTLSSDTSITATAPSHAAGVINVSVTTPAGTSSSSNGSRFTYLEPSSISVSEVDPGIATTAGGTRVTITGSAFAGGATVKIGGVAATNVTVVDSGKIQATTPAHAAGLVDLTVTNPDGQHATLPGGFTYINCQTACRSDTLSTDFSAGTVGTGTYVAATGDGEVQLAPAIGSEFNGTTLDGSWSASAWSSGGAATLASGSVRVDGALVATNTYFAPSHTLDFVATFTAGAPFQHIGLGTDLNSAPWAIFSTGSTGDSLYARSNSSSGSPIDTKLSTSWLNAPHHFQIVWTTTSITYLIDGTQVAQHTIGITGSMRPVISDGPIGGAALTVDWMRLSPYVSTGTFTSRVFDGGGAATWQTFAWTADTSGEGGSMAVSVRTGNTVTPDSSWTAFQNVASSGQTLNVQARYLQYRITLTGSGGTQGTTLRDLVVSFSRSGNPAPTVNSVSPAAGDTTGGTNVTITGENFASGATVTIGGTAATNVSVVNATSITATTPAHAGGAADVAVKNTDGQQGMLVGGFLYQLPPPTLTQLSPASGSSNGGSTITITGTNFTGATSIMFGTSAATNFTVVSNTSITATAPAHAVGTVDVTVTTPSGTSPTSTASKFSFVDVSNSPVIQSRDPGTGPITGGTVVTIRGQQFDSAATVKFGSTPASNVTVVDSTTIQATSPAHATGSVNLIVTNPDGQQATVTNAFTYLDCSGTCVSDTTAANFNAGTLGSGSYVAVGSDGEVQLAPTTASEFSGTALTSGWSASAWSTGGTATVSGGALHVDGALVVGDPLLAAGRTLDFVATFTSGAPFQHIGLGTDLNTAPWAIFSTSSTGDALYARSNSGSGSPQVTTLSAAWLGAPHLFRIVWTATDVTYFIDGAQVAQHTLSIGGSMRPVVSDGPVGGPSLTVDWMHLSPYATSGTFTSRVLDGGGTTTWQSIAWSLDLPASTAITISVRGGNTPTPDGSWTAFQTVSSPGQVINLQDRYIQYRAQMTTSDPNQTPALRDVLISYSRTGSPAPTISSITPNSGPTGGGTNVTIAGSNFASGATVTVGGTAATNVNVVNATSITATTPAHTGGAVDVVVTNTDGQSTTLAAGFTYVTPQPTVTDISPTSGSMDGGTTVTITGTNLSGATSVSFGTTAAAAFTVVSNTSVTATSPAHATGAVDITVTTPSGTSATSSTDRFTFVNTSATPAIQSRDPGTGAAAGGTVITIRGQNFDSAATVKFGGTAATNVTFVDSTSIRATSPAHAAGVVNIVVTNPDGQQATMASGFTYVDCSGSCVADSTAANFNAGTAGTGSYVAITGDGEVQLAPTTGSEFTGTNLPNGWTSNPWSSGGGATVASGALSVDGSLVFANPTVGPGRVVDFVATFAAGTGLQHAGLGTDLNNTPWAIFSTGSTGDALYARTSTGSGSPIDTNLSASWLGAPHHYQIVWTASTITYLIDGAQVAQHTATLSNSMRPVVSDGAVGGATLDVDWLRMSPYAASGTFTSRVFDAGGAATWQNIAWTASLPASTGLTISIRTGNTATPDGSWSAFQQVNTSGQALNLQARYLQYQVALSTSAPDSTPVLQDVLLSYSSTGNPAPSVTAINPATGSSAGGTNVTITGDHFTNGATVTIGGGAATAVTVVNATSITATTPAHATGAVDVVVTNTDGQSATLSGGFTYQAQAPAVTAVNPASGSIDGGDVVTITGTNLTGATAVKFGTVAATNVVVNSGTSVTATSPAHAAGVVDVTVTTPAGTSPVVTADQFTYVATSTATDTTAANFNAGTIGTGVYVSLTDNGEIQLTPGTASEFSGTALPSGWTASPWSSGGAATVNGGALHVDGALVFVNPRLAAGLTLDFVATFSGSPFQHAGLGIDLNGAPWAIFSTGSTGDAVYARTNSGAGSPIDTKISNSWLGAPHHYQIVWTTSNVTYFIDGTQVAQHNLSIATTMRPVISDGPVGGATLDVDWLRMSPYAASGTFTSRVFDAGGAATWQSLSWTVSLPSGTSVTVSVRSGDTATPDGSWSAFQAVGTSGQGFSLQGRYFQYRVVLAATDTTHTPSVSDVTARYLTQ